MAVITVQARSDQAVRSLKKTLKVVDQRTNEVVEQDYKQDLLPKSSQWRSPHFDLDKGNGQWLINMTDDQLNELVAKCHLRDDNDNPILTAERYRITCPFFNHRDLRVKIVSGVESIDDSTPLGALKKAWLTAHPAFAEVSRDYDPFAKRDHRFDVLNDQEKKDLRRKETDELGDALELLIALDEGPMKSIAIALGIGISDDNTAKDIRAMFVEKLTHYRNEPQKDKSRFIDAFVRMASETPLKLYARQVLQEAIRFELVTWNRNAFYFDKQVVALTEEELVNVLSSNKGEMLFQAIQKQVELHKRNIRIVQQREIEDKAELYQLSGSEKVSYFGADGQVEDFVEAKVAADNIPNGIVNFTPPPSSMAPEVPEVDGVEVSATASDPDYSDWRKPDRPLDVVVSESGNVGSQTKLPNARKAASGDEDDKLSELGKQLKERIANSKGNKSRKS